MFTKLLITAAIVAVMFWLAKRKRQPAAAKPLPSTAAVTLQRLAPLFAIVVLLLSAAWMGYGWQQDQQLLLVTVTSAQGEVAEYQVKKGQLQGRRLVTVDGLQVELSQLDRVEVAPLDSQQ
ncbi:hypothetical protein [uncultured Ferrimonas sp.]|uniref:hypothetical protein n=1 Tax=uncultured Ferrimonas sp. TaxID=432640 RepID=UPI002603F676|nr:hypothetical protein [uncultured Ferrimonas sp.]